MLEIQLSMEISRQALNHEKNWQDIHKHIFKINTHYVTNYQQWKVNSSVNFTQYPYNTSAMEQLIVSLMALMNKTALRSPPSPHLRF